MYEFRADVGQTGKAERLPDGRLITTALITKPGVFEYLDVKYPGGIRRELRLDEEVFSKATMDSMQMLPITRGHPPKLLTTDTAKIYSVGATGERVTRERVDGTEDHLATKVMVADTSTIAKMDETDGACSVGYYCEIEKKAGTHPKYGRYDVIQRNIRGNHLAVAIGSARAGDFARVRMDSMNYDEVCARFDGARMDLSQGRMTTEAAGHQHLVDFVTYDGHQRASGETSWSTSQGAAGQHSHPWVRNADGTITIGESAGHKHGLLPEPSLVRTDSGPKRGGVLPPAIVPVQRAGGVMDPEKLQEANRALETGLRKAEQDMTAAVSRADAAETDRDQARGQITQLEKQIAALNVQIAANANAVETAALTEARSRMDAAEAELATLRANRTKEIRERCSLMFDAASVMGPDFRMDSGLSDDQIRRACVKRMDASADISDSVPEGVITGQFQALMKRRLIRAREDATVSGIIGASVQTSQARKDSREQRMADYRNMGKRPLSEVLNRKPQKGA